MGTWGAGNFDSDTAADHLSIVTNKLIDEIQQAMDSPSDLEPDEYWGVCVPCNVELLILIERKGHVGCNIPDVKTVESWYRTYMNVWDSSIDDLEPPSEFKEARRAVLVKTFEALLAVSSKHSAD